MSWDATRYTITTQLQWNLNTRTAQLSALWRMKRLKSIISWAAPWKTTALLLQWSMTQFAQPLRSTQKAQLQVSKENGGNITVKTLFGTVIHASTFTPWRLSTILSGVLKQLDQTVQSKLLAGLMSTVTIYSQRLEPSTLVKCGNFLTQRKESRLISIMNTWAHSITRLGLFWKLLRDMFFWWIALTCLDGLT